MENYKDASYLPEEYFDLGDVSIIKCPRCLNHLRKGDLRKHLTVLKPLEELYSWTTKRRKHKGS